MARFGPGVAGELPAFLDALGVSGWVTVADERVAALHEPPVSGPRLLLPAGEKAKRKEVWLDLLDRLVGAGLDRSGLVVAFGGGAALDVAGFAAAVYLRGVRWVALPTTLLAQVDAAHGGKTAIDWGAAKNLVGAFHPPEEVFADAGWLSTLPRREVACGLAEVVKHAVIGAPALLGVVGREDPGRFLEEAARVKIEIVARDPEERGERALLNLGHTFGHAFEGASGFSLPHGEAVALGLRAACRVAARHCGFAGSDAVEAALDRCGLPSRFSGDVERALALLSQDKKRRRGRLRFVLPVALGDVRVYDDVPESLIRDAMWERKGAS